MRSLINIQKRNTIWTHYKPKALALNIGKNPVQKISMWDNCTNGETFIFSWFDLHFKYHGICYLYDKMHLVRENYCFLGAWFQRSLLIYVFRSYIAFRTNVSQIILLLCMLNPCREVIGRRSDSLEASPSYNSQLHEKSIKLGSPCFRQMPWFLDQCFSLKFS